MNSLTIVIKVEPTPESTDILYEKNGKSNG